MPTPNESSRFLIVFRDSDGNEPIGHAFADTPEGATIAARGLLDLVPNGLFAGDTIRVYDREMPATRD